MPLRYIIRMFPTVHLIVVSYRCIIECVNNTNIVVTESGGTNFSILHDPSQERVSCDQAEYYSCICSLFQVTNCKMVSEKKFGVHFLYHPTHNLRPSVAVCNNVNAKLLRYLTPWHRIAWSKCPTIRTNVLPPSSGYAQISIGEMYKSWSSSLRNILNCAPMYYPSFKYLRE